jgi:capsular exopolysaccharide synthesis family protein
VFAVPEEVELRPSVEEELPQPPSDCAPPNAGIPASALRLRDDAAFDLGAADHRIRTVMEPLTIVGEQFRVLRAKLSIMQKQRGLKVLLITSSVAEEGKTFTACCLAGVFAQEPGRRVLLLDVDLRKPKADQNLGMPGRSTLPGFAQVLQGKAKVEDVLLRSKSMDFFLLPAGSVPDNPSELLSSPLLEQTLKTLCGYFDWIVLDSPPVLALADATLIAPLCDATLLVVRTSRTPTKTVKEAIVRIGRDRICGVLMNRGKERHSSRYYRRYYYHSSSR